MLRRNILIFHQAALGDFVVTWPLAMALSRIFAQSRVIYVTHSQKGKLAERVLRVDSVDVEAGWHGLFAEPPTLAGSPRKLLDAAQLIVSFTAGDSDRLAAGIGQIAPDVKVLSLNTKREHSGHVSESIAAQLEGSPLAEGVRQILRSIAARGVGFSRTPGADVVVHPGAGKEANRWPAERYLELLSRLRSRGRTCRVLLGEAELEKWPAETMARFEAVATARRPQTLIELVSELTSAAAFVGNDSGPGHLAGILGVPSISLFGPSDPTRWRPLGPAVRVLRSEELSDLPVAQVEQALLSMLEGKQ